MGRILDSDRLAQMGQQLRQELASSNELAGDWIRRAARVMAEQMLSAEVEEALGRGSYQRRVEEGQAGYRNGYKSRSMRTAEGKVAVDVPQVRGRQEPYRSAIWPALARRSPSSRRVSGGATSCTHSRGARSLRTTTWTFAVVRRSGWGRTSEPLRTALRTTRRESGPQNAKSGPQRSF